ncbi:Protein of unknown function [Gryllus bimaculatus]|nr:Protein of unknown function [Gryllus bimaculatus]
MRMRRMSVVFWKSYSRLKWICPTFSTGSLLSMYMSTSEMERLCRNAIWGQGGTGVSACGRAQTQGLAAVLCVGHACKRSRVPPPPPRRRDKGGGGSTLLFYNLDVLNPCCWVKQHTSRPRRPWLEKTKKQIQTGSHGHRQVALSERLAGILLESATETSKYAPSNLMRCKNSVISHSPTARSTYQEQYKILPFAQISSK